MSTMRERDWAVSGKKTVLSKWIYFTDKNTAFGLNGVRKSSIERKSLKGRVDKRSLIVNSS